MSVFWLTGAYAGGIVLAAILGIPNSSVLFPVGGLLCIAWAIVRKSSWAVLPSFGAFMMLGFVWSGIARMPPPNNNHVSRFISEKPVVIEGRMLNLATFCDGRSRFDLDVTNIRQGTTAASASGRVRVSVRQGAVDIADGQTLRLRSRLRAPRNFGCPGEFDYAGHLASQKIFATAALTEARQIVPISQDPTNAVGIVSKFRSRVAACIDRAVPAEEAGLVQALVLGLRERITPEQRRALSEGGVAHLFAISGLHFGMLGLLLYTIFRWLYCRSEWLLFRCPPRRVIPLLLILPLAFYLVLTGNGLPTRRAFYMTTAASLLYSSNRNTPILRLLATAALVILVTEPLALFQPAFQLSFAGLFGIVYWLPVWQKPLMARPIWQRWPGLICLTSLAAALATAPLTLWHFHIFAPAGLLANLAATPLLAWGAVPIGLTGILLQPVAPAAADTCFAGVGALVAIALYLVKTLSSLPGLTARYYFPGWSDIVVMLLFLAAISIRRLSWQGWVVRCMLLITGLTVWLCPAQPDQGLQVVALSVGQGDATLLTTDDQKHYLIDGGGFPGSSFDPGERLVAPAFGRLKIKRLEGVILTHNHPDHWGGLKYILKHFPVAVFYSGQPPGNLDPDLQAILKQRNIPVKILAGGWTSLTAEARAPLKIFSPRQNHRDENERSLAIYAGFGDDGVLLTGDLGASGLNQLLEAGLPGRANLLKIPHHGSRRSAPQDYLATFKPQLAFVSAGSHNIHRLPHPETIRCCSDYKVPLYRTDTGGTLTFRSKGHGWTRPDRPHGFSIDET